MQTPCLFISHALPPDRGNIISIKVSEIRKAKALSAPLRRSKKAYGLNGVMSQNIEVFISAPLFFLI
jgi:hypothetical protein